MLLEAQDQTGEAFFVARERINLFNINKEDHQVAVSVQLSSKQVAMPTYVCFIKKHRCTSEMYPVQIEQTFSYCLWCTASS